MESQFHKFQTEQPLSFIIILGGGMSNIDYIYDNIDEVIKKNIFSDFFHTKIVKNTHDDSGGVRGAAWL